MRPIFNTTLILVFAFLGQQVYAQKGSTGGSSISIGAALVTPGQDDLNAHITRTNTTQTQSVSKFGSGYEFFAEYAFDIGTMFALGFRPSYFMQSTSGGSYKYNLTGMTLFPMFRIVPLQNAYIKFFMQAGVGYGRLSGKIEQPDGSVEFAGGTFGGLVGLGSLFCFSPSHCIGVEGNLRYLPISRNLVTAQTGTVTDFTQTTKDNELEFENSDVGTSMSGIIGAVHYTMNF